MKSFESSTVTRNRYLILNGDDFGLSEGVNRGIVESHKEGFLSSTTLLVNTPGFEDAVRLSKETPSLSIGLHLNIVRGRPILSPDNIPSIVDRDGSYLSLSGLFTSVALGKVNFSEVEAELRAQIEKALSNGINITHIDSHRHFHLFPALFGVIKKLALEFSIRKMRMVRIVRFNGPRFILKELLLHFFSSRCRKKVLDAPMLTNNYFLDPFCDMDKNNVVDLFEKLIKGLPEGVTEFGCHPGYNAGITVEGESSYDREKDMAFLRNPALREIVFRHNIKLVSYKEIKSE